MKKPSIQTALTIAALTCLAGWLVSEVRWSRINNPSGKFSTVDEYLAQARQPSSVGKANKGGATYYVAYSPMDSWLAVPSGPAAYVFDETGQLVDWTSDTGDDATFRATWPLPHQKLSIDELRHVVHG